MATYYVRPVNGSDGNAGTSFGAAWQTVQKAADTAVAGDIVLLCDEGVYSPSAVIDFDTNSGNASSGPIRFIAADSAGNPVPDGSTPFVIDDTNLSASSVGIFNVTASAQNIYMLGVELDGSSGNAFSGISGNVTSGCAGWVLGRCHLHDFGTAGIYHRAPSATPLSLVGTVIHDCGAGVKGDGASGSGRFMAFFCQIHDCTDGIIAMAGNCVGVGLQFWDIGGSAVSLNGAADNSAFAMCTVDGAPLLTKTSTNCINTHVIACSMNNSPTYGIVPYSTQHAVNNNQDVLGFNHYQGNTSGYIANSSGGLNDGQHGFNNVEGAPSFVSTTEGSEDYHFADGSPLQDNGPLGDFIGALPIDPAEIGGGGGGFVPPGIQPLESGVA